MRRAVLRSYAFISSSLPRRAAYLLPASSSSGALASSARSWSPLLRPACFGALHGGRQLLASSSLPPRPGDSAPSPGAELDPERLAKEMDYTAYIAKMEGFTYREPTRTQLFFSLLMGVATLVPIGILIYYMIFPVPLEENYWYQLEQQHRERVQRAIEEANRAVGRNADGSSTNNKQ